MIVLEEEGCKVNLFPSPRGVGALSAEPSGIPQEMQLYSFFVDSANCLRSFKLLDEQSARVVLLVDELSVLNTTP